MRTVVVTVTQEEKFSIVCASRSDEDALEVAKKVIDDSDHVEFIHAEILKEDNVQQNGSGETERIH